MSTQINQYLIHGIRLPYEWSEEWEQSHKDELPEYDGFYTRFEEYLSDSAYEDGWPQKDGITMLVDERDGKWIFIGHCMAKAKEGDLLGEEKPLLIDPNPLPSCVADFLKAKVKKVFGVEGDWRTYLVTMLR